MGLLRMAIKAANPVRTTKRAVKRAVVPKPIRAAQRTVRNVASPVGYVEGKAINTAIGAADRAVTPRAPRKGRKTRRSRR